MNRAADPSPSDRASDALSFVSGYLYRVIRFQARELGIRWSALMVLRDLAVLGPSRQKALADIEQMREPTMTVLLARMEADGWIERRPDHRDARAKLVGITGTGKRELAAAARVLRRRMNAELESLQDEQIEALAAGLEPLVRAIMHRIHQAPEGEREFR